MAVPPILDNKHPSAPSVFLPAALMREARRQKNIKETDVPAVCLLDPDGDLVRHLRRYQSGSIRPPRYSDVAVPRELMLQFVVDTFLTALTWRLEKRPKLAPSQINEMFRHLVTRGIGRAIVANGR
jgi:hypothetical protein